jgi:RNA polymerase sigma-70 factor (sigma-E family)
MKMKEMTDKDGAWVASSEAAGNWPQGFVDTYRSRWVPMVRLARLLTAGDPAAEELVQDAFLRVRARWDAIENPAAYVRAAVVNGCRNHQRRRKIERRQTPAHNVADGARFELRAALESLPVRQRTAVVLRYYEDLPEAEIAELLDCSVAAVKSLLHRAVQDLRKVVER